MNNPYKNLAVFAYVAVAGLVIQGLLHLSSIFTGLAQILVPDLSFEGIEGDAISVWFMIQAFIFFYGLPPTFLQRFSSWFGYTEPIRTSHG